MKLGEVDTHLWMCISCSHKERGKISCLDRGGKEGEWREVE